MERATTQPRPLGAATQRLTARHSDSSERSWNELMVAAQAGDASAYRRLLTDATAWLRRYFWRRLPPAMIDDVIQETLIAIHEKRHTYDPGRPFVAWLAAIARYKWIDALRSLKARPTEALGEDISVPVDEQTITSAWSLERLLERLKPAQANVIRLVKLQGLSIEEASRASGQSASLVKINIHRGLRRLTSLIQDENDAD